VFYVADQIFITRMEQFGLKCNLSFELSSFRVRYYTADRPIEIFYAR